MSEDDDILAARFALGLSDDSETMNAERRQSQDAAFAAEVRRYENLFAALHVTTPMVRPTAGLFDRIEAEISRIEDKARPVLIRSDALPWQRLSDALEMKVLYEDEGGARILLYRAGPGAVVERHRNVVTEECFVLDGEIEVGGEAISRGELHIVYPYSDHARIVSRTGATLYIRESLAAE